MPSRIFSARWCFGVLLALVLPATVQAQVPAFPGAQGFGAIASGGRGGAVYHVTTLAPDPSGTQPGSLNHALRQTGPRTIVFEVSGVIHAYADIVHGDVTLAGQTSPGGVIVRGLICDGHYERNDCGNLIVRHLRVRPGWNLSVPPGGERLDDGLRLDGLSRFIFDHVSVANATDEAVQVSWASDGTIQNSIFAETIGEHADRGGMLLNYSSNALPQNRLSIIRNLWYRIGGRVPEITCEASGFDGEPGSIADCQAHALQLEVSNNYYFDPGFLMYYNRDVDQNPAAGPYRLQMNLAGNRMRVRSSYPYGFALHDLLDVSANQLFISDNTIDRYPDYSDLQLFYCCNDFPEGAPNTDPGSATLRGTRHPFGTLAYLPGANPTSIGLRAYLLAQAGAHPRDPMDRRYLAQVQSDTISNTPWGTPLANDAFNTDFITPPSPPADTDRDGMPDAFEQQYAGLGLNPAVFDANGSQLSIPFTGVAGYTNLECYLNRLADERAGMENPRVFGNGFERL